MLFFYFLLMTFILINRNVYVVWLLMEIMFIYFLLISLTYENKSIGLVVYFFFQSFMSLLIFISIFFIFEKIIFLLLSAKLGLFPFFYWMVVVSVKVGFITNIFVLRFQKVAIFWLIWLLINVSFSFLLILVYLRMFFVIFSLLLVSDLWIVLIYSSISNTGMLIISVYGRIYFFVVFLYLFIVFFIVWILSKSDSYIELIFVVFFFLVIPPFVLFFMKFYVILSLDFYLKLTFFFVIFDVLILLYYFSLVFMKFMLFEVNFMVYFINLILIFLILFFRNCVAMIVIYKS